MARLWMSGFGLNSVTTSMEFSSITGTVSIQNTVTRVGPYALRVNPASGASFVRYHYTDGTVGSDLSTNVRLRFYLRVDTAPSTNTTIARIANQGNNACAQLRITSTRTLAILDAGNNTVGSASAALTIGTWYMIELGLDSSTNPGTIYGRLSGTQFATGANSAQSPWSRIVLGSITGTAIDMYIADVALNDTSGSFQNSWPDAGVVYTIVPGSDGDNSQWRKTDNVTSGDNTSWQLVNQIPPDDATSYTQTLTATAQDSFVLASTGVGAGTVNVVQVCGRHSNTPSADATTAFKYQIKKASGGTVVQSAAIIPNSTTFVSNAGAEPRNAPITLHQDPDATNWTLSTLGTTQIGYQMTAANTNRIRVSGVWALADITPSTVIPISGSDTASGADTTTTQTAAASAPETATGADTVTSIVASGTASADTTAGSDAGTVSAAVPVTEIATGVDAASIAVATAGADTSSGAEAGIIAATTSNADTAAGTEGIGLAVTITTGDSATAVDTESVSGSAQVSDADTGSSADTGSVAAGIPQSDVAAGTEATALAVTITATDVGTAVDTESVDTSASITATDSATGADAATVAAASASADTGSGTEGASVGLNGAETGAGVDQGTLAATLTATETAQGAEVTTMGPLSSESSSGADTAAVTANIFGSDSASGVDNQVLTTDATPISGADTAAGAETATTSAAQSAADTAIGVEAIGARAAQLPDIASGVEAGTVAALVPVTDLGGSAEGAFVTAIISASDTSGVAETGLVAASITQGDTGTGAEANDPTSVQYTVTEVGTAADATVVHAALHAGDIAQGIDNAVYIGLFGSDIAVAVETSEVETSSNVPRSSGDLAHAVETQAIGVSIFAADTARGTEGYDVHITPRRVHKVMPYYVRERQDWAIEQERRRHNQALWYVGENTMFVLMWHLEDFQSQLVNRCPTCYESQGMIAEIYGQTDEYKCPDCFGTTFEGGFKAIIVRPAIFSDSDEGETKHSRGVIHPNDLSIDSTPDFRVRTGDYCFRQNGDRFFLRVPERITLRTGFGDPSQGGTAIAYNHANAAQEDPSNVSYMIPPAGDEVAAILSRISRVPRPWNSFEVIRAPLIPGGEFAPVLIWNNAQSSGGSPAGGSGVPGGVFIYQQPMASMVWTITHDLGHQPASVTIFDASGAEADGIVSYPSANQVRIDFAVALAGSAHLN